MTKVLYSPGFGAGWSTWCHEGREQREFVLRYQPLIEAIEAGQDIGFDPDDRLSNPKPNSVLAQFVADFEAKFGEESHMYLGGACDLAVAEVDGPFRVDEYDGNESIVPYAPEDFYDFD